MREVTWAPKELHNSCRERLVGAVWKIPYDAFQALHKSARWLAELRDQFGDVGLAAAAYNAGPGRIQNWLFGRTFLPSETRHYVRIITGVSADQWSQPSVKDNDRQTFSTLPCKTIASSVSITTARP